MAQRYGGRFVANVEQEAKRLPREPVAVWRKVNTTPFGAPESSHRIVKWSKTGDFVTFPEAADEPRGEDAQREVAAVEAQAREAEARAEAAEAAEHAAEQQQEQVQGATTAPPPAAAPAPADDKMDVDAVAPAVKASATAQGLTLAPVAPTLPTAEQALVSAAGGVGGEVGAPPPPPDSQETAGGGGPQVSAQLHAPPSGLADALAATPPPPPQTQQAEQKVDNVVPEALGGAGPGVPGLDAVAPVPSEAGGTEPVRAIE